MLQAGHWLFFEYKAAGKWFNLLSDDGSTQLSVNMASIQKHLLYTRLSRCYSCHLPAFLEVVIRCRLLVRCWYDCCTSNRCC